MENKKRNIKQYLKYSFTPEELEGIARRSCRAITERQEKESELKDYEEKTVTVRRLDTLDIVSERALTNAELQLELIDNAA